MNNNNNNRNNRRRGRGNRPQGGSGSQLNRIDSRARGNAPQMLDKFKKLAQDAQHNGDRVQMEYYLQFADHYFRVIADNKVRVEEPRGGRRPDERDQAEEYGDDDLDFDRGRRSEQPTRSRYEQHDNDVRGDSAEGEQGNEGESFLSDDRGEDRGNVRADGRSDGQPRQPNARRQPRKPREDNRGDGARADRPERAERTERAERPQRAERPERTAERAAERPSERAATRPERSDVPRSDAPRSEKPADKPAVRARKPRKPVDDDRGVIDSSILPPSLRSDDSRDSSGDSDGTLEAVG